MKADKDKIAIQYLFESEPDYAWTAKDIAHTLQLRGKQLGRLHAILKEMVKDGIITPTRESMAYTLTRRMDLLTGQLHLVRNGAGNVTDRETGEQVWIEPEDPLHEEQSHHRVAHRRLVRPGV